MRTAPTRQVCPWPRPILVLSPVEFRPSSTGTSGLSRSGDFRRQHVTRPGATGTTIIQVQGPIRVVGVRAEAKSVWGCNGGGDNSQAGGTMAKAIRKILLREVRGSNQALRGDCHASTADMGCSSISSGPYGR